MATILVNIIIAFALFSLFLRIVGKTQFRKIKETANIDEALQQKKILLKKRKTCLYIFIALLIIIQVAVIVSSYYYSRLYPGCSEQIFYKITIPTYFGLPFYIIILVAYLNIANKNNELLGNLSTRKASDLLMSEEKFVLYLRGFESDIYSKKKAKKTDFSEDALSKAVLKGLGLQLCAVGMTKEIECPLGGFRVYVNDKCWEEEVLKLMNKAEKIIYLVNDRESCIWEIKNSKILYQKCIFIVDNLAKYNNVKSKLSDTLDLPNIPASDFEDLPLEYDPRRYYFSSDNIMVPFNGTPSDYCQMLGLEPDALSESDLKDSKNTPFYKRPWFIVLLTIFGIVSLLSSIASIHTIYECIHS